MAARRATPPHVAARLDLTWLDTAPHHTTPHRTTPRRTTSSAAVGSLLTVCLQWWRCALCSQAAFRRAWRVYKDDLKVERLTTSPGGNSFIRLKTRVGPPRGAKPATNTFQAILSSVEASKTNARGNSFTKHKAALQRHSTESGLGAQEKLLLRKQLDSLQKGQREEARRAEDLLARNEALELHTSVLDQKLELIMQMLGKQPIAQRTPTAGGDRTSSPDGAQRRRRSQLKGAIQLARLSSADQLLDRVSTAARASAAANAAGAPAGGGLGGLVAAAAQRQPQPQSPSHPFASEQHARQRCSRQSGRESRVRASTRGRTPEERDELREALDLEVFEA